MDQKIIDRFNTSDTNLVISGYPEKDSRGENNYGIAWYTKETIEPIAEKFGTKFVVLAETNHNNDPKLYQNGKILILKVFDQKHPSLYPRILKWLLTFNKINNVFVHSEFCTNGGIKNFILLIPFLALIKFSRKRITYFSHNVVTELTGIAPHLNLNKNGVTLKILNLAVKIYYKILGKLCNKIVVMDEEMKRRLINFVEEEKITYVPFWIKEQDNSLTKEKARKILGIKDNKLLILYFGFITWYKGADWLIDQFKNIKSKNIELILAGGEAYSLKDKGYYQKFYQSQLQKVKDCQNIKITGFVKEHNIEKYFLASDLVVLPYRGLIGSSGTLNYALQFKKPFLLSKEMEAILNNQDFNQSLKQSRLKKSDILFNLNNRSFSSKLKLAKNKRFLTKLEKLSISLGDQKSFDELLPRYFQLIFKNNVAVVIDSDKRPIYVSFQPSPKYIQN